jgi:LysR substrate binding domain
MEGVREVVLAGVSAAIACEWTFAPELKRDQVKIVLTDPRLPPCELWAVIPAGRMARIKTRVFITFVKETHCKCEHDDDASSIQELLLAILTRCRNVVRDVAEVDSGNLPHCAARSARSIPFRRPP